MRVTDRTIAQNSIQNITNSLGEYNETLERNASAKQFRWASDNVTNAVAALDLRSTIEMHDAYIENAKTTDLWMTATNSAIEDMEDLALRAINLTITGLSDTMGEDQRIAIATELDTMITQAVGIANTQHQGNYIFAGFQTDTKPFALELNPTPPPDDIVTYYGDVGIMTRNVGPDQPVVTNVNGMLFSDVGHNIFTDLITIRDALLTYDRGIVETGLSSLQETRTYIANEHTGYAGIQRELHDTMERMDYTKIDLKSLLSQKEDINMAEAATMLTKTQMVYQTTLQVSSRAISMMNLFDRI